MKTWNRVKIPRHADEPPHLLLWSVDEIAPILLGMCIGIMVRQMLLCMLIGFFMTSQYKRVRDNNPDGFFLHYLYWYGVPVCKSKQFVNPFIRNFIP